AVLGRPGGAGRAGAIVAGVLSASGGYALGSLRARKSGAGFSVVEISDIRETGEGAGGAGAAA
ncbi:glycosyltransferase family 2 protein, partial [Streptomyces sp. NPDC005918]